MAAKTGQKGYALEELLRAYFIRAGVYAVRGVPLRIESEDLTDVDIWLYERPTGSSRRRQIVDAKSKNKPKAVERLFWTRGLQELLQVDGSYIATTDTRTLLKELSRRIGVSVLDGADIRRMADSDKVLFPNRITEDNLYEKIKHLDKSRRGKDTQTKYEDLKSALVDNFGSGTVNRGLDHVTSFSSSLVEAHPSSAASEILMRLLYISASISAVAMDYVLTQVSFKSTDERRQTIQNVIRYGEGDEARGLEKVRIATALIEKYATNGSAVAHSVNQAVRDDYARVPAEIIADHIIKSMKAGGLFEVARALELRAFSTDLLGFDDLPKEEKAFLGVLLDFAGVGRASVAESWMPMTKSGDHSATEASTDSSTDNTADGVGPLFEDPDRKA